MSGTSGTRLGSLYFSSQKAAERHHEAKPKIRRLWEPGGSRANKITRPGRMSGGQGLHQGRTRPVDRGMPSSRHSQQQLRTAGTTTCSMLSQHIFSLTAWRDCGCCGFHNKPPPGTKPGQVFVETGSTYGARDAGRACYQHSKKVVEAMPDLMDQRLSRHACR